MPKAQDLMITEVSSRLGAAAASQFSDDTPAEIGWHMAYLADSIAAGTPGPLCGYTQWAQRWLSSQGMPDTLLRQGYEALSAAIGNHLPEHAAREASSILQEARRLL
ncbi:hypothetical protein K2Z83_16175 [Oscillochloris sp. ZM17-4]|uniref:hypothetical protein n=1 Tax=Oscillochloris sp. ZM17-4 TaxID=2866714 RepID=UPI001C72CF0E|nr:hypothetical protein [Oscillochloris sp. ZM17-4]MBX0329211.1 hypothetical protein [Oscillochloris sp. ZM17-4]